MDILLERDNGTLHLLASKGNASLVKRLLAAGYNPDTKDTLGRSALHVATLLGHFMIANELISSATDIDLKDGEGRTALDLALLRKRPDLIELYLEHSASTTGITAGDWRDAYDREATDAVHLVERSGGKKTIQFIEQGVTSHSSTMPGALRLIQATPGEERRLM
jgi:ankyrin repeat protein